MPCHFPLSVVPVGAVESVGENVRAGVGRPSAADTGPERCAVRGGQADRAPLRILTSSASGVRPTICCTGLSLPLNSNTRGMVVTSYLIARSEFSSTLTLPTLTLPANWSAILSMVGDSWRHGPHHGAQKSTRTGWADWATSACQFSDVNSTTFLLAIAD